MTAIHARSVEELRQRTLDALAGLCVVPGSSLSDLAKSVANVSGYRIAIDPIGTRAWETVTGLLVLSDRDREARVLIRKSDPRWYQFHSVLHELSHLALGHRGCSQLPAGARTGVRVRPGQTLLARVVAQPDLESDLDFSDAEIVRETEAEKLSQLIAQVMLGPKHRQDERVLG